MKIMHLYLIKILTINNSNNLLFNKKQSKIIMIYNETNIIQI
jgi:hypothetical protein